MLLAIYFQTGKNIIGYFEYFDAGVAFKFRVAYLVPDNLLLLTVININIRIPV